MVRWITKGILGFLLLASAWLCLNHIQHVAIYDPNGDDITLMLKVQSAQQR